MRRSPAHPPTHSASPAPPHPTLLCCRSGVPAIKPRINPANWMLEVASPDAEKQTGLNFAEIYQGSELAKAAEAMVDQFRWV